MHCSRKLRNGNFTTTAYFPFFSSSSSADLLTVKDLENNGVIPALYWDQNAFNPPVKWATPNNGLCESPCGEGPLYFISLISLLWFTPCKGIRIPEYGKIVLVKSRIRNAEKFWFWNPNSLALKSRIQLNESGIPLNPSSTDEDWNPVLGIWIPRRGIKNPTDFLGFHYMGRNLIDRLFQCTVLSLISSASSSVLIQSLPVWQVSGQTGDSCVLA